MVRCSVIRCKSDSERKLPDISFHSFPDNENVRQIWIKATGRTDWTVKKSSRICSQHFDRNVLIKKKKLTILHPNAIPKMETQANIPTTFSSVSSMEIDDNLEIKTHFVKEQDRDQFDKDNPIHHDVKETSLPNYTPRTMRRNWKYTQQKSNERLKKLKALREKSRRLTKRVAQLETVIGDLKAKSSKQKKMES